MANSHYRESWSFAKGLRQPYQSQNLGASIQGAFLFALSRRVFVNLAMVDEMNIDAREVSIRFVAKGLRQLASPLNGSGRARDVSVRFVAKGLRQLQALVRMHNGVFVSIRFVAKGLRQHQA